ncbi:MAG: hypothetical protein LBH92_05865, partial [Bacteroidales bacterium]|nr:hypothetical protein [Bacteroidales bacterium]
IIENSGKSPVLWQKNEINKKAFGIRISVVELFSDITQAKNELVNQAAATTRAFEYKKIHDLIDIQVKTIYDYSEKYPAREDISDLFVGRMEQNRCENYSSVANLISEINRLSSSPYSDFKFDLYLMDFTAYSQAQSFEIKLILSNGDELTNRTNDIIFY